MNSELEETLINKGRMRHTQCEEALMSEIQELSKWMTKDKREDALVAMMPRIMAITTKASRGRMPQIMAELMPKCLKTLLPKLSKEDRVEFALLMISILVEKGSVRMSEEEREEFVSQLTEQVNSKY